MAIIVFGEGGANNNDEGYQSKGPSAIIWHKKLFNNSTIKEIANEVAKANQSGFIKNE